MNDIAEAATDRKPALEWVLAKEQVEDCFLIGLARFPITIGHCELVKVRQERLGAKPILR
jgi:hypothetical protein